MLKYLFLMEKKYYGVVLNELFKKEPIYVHNVKLRFLFLQDYQHKSQSLWKVTVRGESILYQTLILTRNGNQAQKKLKEILVSSRQYKLLCHVSGHKVCFINQRVFSNKTSK